jgi:ubiquinone/menaquinone biosynthesis methyltransferase
MTGVAPGGDVRGMFDRIAGRYDRANRLMSAGIDVRWRRTAVRALLAELGPAPRVLDLGAGTLDGSLELLRLRPGARLVAADFARNMLLAGRRKPGAGAVAVHAADGHRLPYRAGAFDGAFSAFCVRNLALRPMALAELRRVVRPGGSMAILEFFRPERRRPVLDGLYNQHLLPLIGWLATGDRAAYRYLPESIARFASRAELEAELRQAGFADVRGRDFFPGAVASLVLAR